MSELELSNWASIIYMLPTYGPQGETQEARWAEGESAVWDVIQRLATPEVFDPLSSELIVSYLSKLEA